LSHLHLLSYGAPLEVLFDEKLHGIATGHAHTIEVEVGSTPKANSNSTTVPTAMTRNQITPLQLPARAFSSLLKNALDSHP
jgi:hypothetical protein